MTTATPGPDPGLAAAQARALQDARTRFPALTRNGQTYPLSFEALSARLDTASQRYEVLIAWYPPGVRLTERGVLAYRLDLQSNLLPDTPEVRSAPQWQTTKLPTAVPSRTVLLAALMAVILALAAAQYMGLFQLLAEEPPPVLTRPRPTVSAPPTPRPSPSPQPTPTPGLTSTGLFVEKHFQAQRGERASISYSARESGATSVRQVEVAARSPIEDGVLLLVPVDKRPGETPPPRGIVYAYFDLEMQRISPDSIEQAAITFALDHRWLADKEIERDKVTLWQYSNEAWVSLPTRFVREEGEALLYTATTSRAFSLFAVVGQMTAATPTPTPQPSPAPVTRLGSPTPTPSPTPPMTPPPASRPTPTATPPPTLTPTPTPTPTPRPTPTPTPAALTLRVTVRGPGSVAPLTGEYRAGQQAVVRATPNEHYAFARWEGDVPDASVAQNPLGITMTSNVNLVAVFVPRQYPLTVMINGNGTVAPPSGPFEYGARVILTAAPGGGWGFYRWEGDASDSSLSVTITVDGPKRVTAVFSPPDVSLSVVTSGEGTVTPKQGTYPRGALVPLVAQAAAGWSLHHWEGDLTGSSTPVNLVMDYHKRITAVFLPDRVELQSRVVGEGRVMPPSGSFNFGHQLVVTAQPAAGWRFDHWGGAADGTASTATVTMTDNLFVLAFFVQVVTDPTEQILTSVQTSTGWQVYRAKSSGADRRPLTSNTFDNRWPVWSSDKSKIAYASLRNGKWDIYVAYADGTRETRITDTPTEERQATWSPDNRRLAFAAQRNLNWDIYVIDAQAIMDATPPVDLQSFKVTQLTSPPSVDWEPTWSPKGDRIAFATDRDGKFHIWVMNPDGSNAMAVTSGSFDDIQPSWSPDGSKIAFSSNRSGNWQIYTVYVDASNLRRLATNSFNDRQPSWSDDGTRIAFRTDREGAEMIYIVNADGTNPQRMPPAGANNVDPSWSGR
ncbi:MAG: PD40 domain-containing protein [Chloroflexi bacterium]|nr:PD40 domain-containing protein [Chloroflexota bacterium]